MDVLLRDISRCSISERCKKIKKFLDENVEMEFSTENMRKIIALIVYSPFYGIDCLSPLLNSEKRILSLIADCLENYKSLINALICIERSMRNFLENFSYSPFLFENFPISLFKEADGHGVFHYQKIYKDRFHIFRFLCCVFQEKIGSIKYLNGALTCEFPPKKFLALIKKLLPREKYFGCIPKISKCSKIAKFIKNVKMAFFRKIKNFNKVKKIYSHFILRRIILA